MDQFTCGKLTIIRQFWKDGGAMWEAQCSCGTRLELSYLQLRKRMHTGTACCDECSNIRSRERSRQYYVQNKQK